MPESRHNGFSEEVQTPIFTLGLDITRKIHGFGFVEGIARKEWWRLPAQDAIMRQKTI